MSAMEQQLSAAMEQQLSVGGGLDQNAGVAQQAPVVAVAPVASVPKQVVVVQQQQQPVLVQPAVLPPQQAQVQPVPAQQQQPHKDGSKNDIDDVTGKIFIGGLSWQTTTENLRYYFEKFGELTDVAIMIDKKTGKPR
jgi:hypothetical protein